MPEIEWLAEGERAHRLHYPDWPDWPAWPARLRTWARAASCGDLVDETMTAPAEALAP